MMGTTGGNRERLYKTVEDSKVYAIISPQMGKQVNDISLRLVANLYLRYFYNLYLNRLRYDSDSILKNHFDFARVDLFQVVAFLAAMEIMAEQFPGAFAGYSLQVYCLSYKQLLFYSFQDIIVSLWTISCQSN